MFNGDVDTGCLVLVDVGEGGTTVGVKVGCGVHVGLGSAIWVETSGDTDNVDGGVAVPVQAFKINAPAALTRTNA